MQYEKECYSVIINYFCFNFRLLFQYKYQQGESWHKKKSRTPGGSSARFKKPGVPELMNGLQLFPFIFLHVLN